MCFCNLFHYTHFQVSGGSNCQPTGRKVFAFAFAIFTLIFRLLEDQIVNRDRKRLGFSRLVVSADARGGAQREVGPFILRFSSEQIAFKVADVGRWWLVRNQHRDHHVDTHSGSIQKLAISSSSDSNSKQIHNQINPHLRPCPHKTSHIPSSP